jgi:hypothetical protein
MINSMQSRYRNTAAYQDENSRWYLGPRRRFLFRDLPDNRIHICMGGERLYQLADRYFQPLPDASRLYWVIADFQPVTIVDATLTMEAGDRLFIPSVRAVQDYLATGGRRTGSR